MNFLCQKLDFDRASVILDRASVIRRAKAYAEFCFSCSVGVGVECVRIAQSFTEKQPTNFPEITCGCSRVGYDPTWYDPVAIKRKLGINGYFRFVLLCQQRAMLVSESTSE